MTMHAQAYLTACANFYKIIEVKDVWRVIGKQCGVTNAEFDALLPIFSAMVICLFMNNYSGNETVNAGRGKKLTIRELTELVTKVVRFTGRIEWDASKPNGTPRKLLDASKVTVIGWTYKTELEDGIRMSYKDFLENPMKGER